MHSWITEWCFIKVTYQVTGWAPIPPTQAIATGGNALFAQELGWEQWRRRSGRQEEVVADKTKTSKAGGGRSLNYCFSLGSPLSLSCPPFTLNQQLERRSPRLHYPTKCISGLLLRTGAATTTAWGMSSQHHCSFILVLKALHIIGMEINATGSSPSKSIIILSTRHKYIKHGNGSHWGTDLRIPHSD